MQLKVILVVAAVMAAFAGYCVYHNYRRKQQLIQKVKKSWGKRPDREYSFAEYDAITHYFQRRQKAEFCVDDITWNDLDMDTIFMLLNHTWSCIGESCLYNMLRTPSFSNEKLEERDRLAEYFLANPNKREQMEVFFAGIGKTGARSVFDYIYNLADYEQGSNLIHYAGMAAIVLSITAIAAAPQYGILALIASVGFCWSTYFSRRKKIEPYVLSCSCLLEMLRAAEKIQKLKSPEIQEYLDCLMTAGKQFKKFKRNSFFVIAGGAMNAGGGIEQSIAAYLNFTFHLDLIQFSTLVRELREHISAFEELTENLGALECAIAVASFRTMMEEHCKPDLSRSKEVFLHTENIYHPMIEEPVKNTISVERGVLLTGSNASGKSTFLKTIAINALLAQSIYTCLADSYRGNFYQIYSSMALRDDLMSQESYFIVEIKSLKRILDHLGEENPLLCFVDEVLRGTNTVERIAASSEILESMARTDVMCFAATHDIELTHILEGEYENFHFQEEVVEEAVLFNYKLYEGRAVSRNAIKLLGIMGYNKSIISRAEEAAEHFIETGEWRNRCIENL